MRFVHIAAVLSVLCAFAGVAATTATKKARGPKKMISGNKKAAPARKATGKTVASSSARAKTKGKAARKAPAATWRNRQQNPTPDRYKEIQQALVAKGYLKSEPDGVWNADSVSALQRFQADQKLTPTGKINAPSLIGLGLGAKSAGASEAAPITPGPTPAPALTPAPAASQ